jgi:hypothetical protein
MGLAIDRRTRSDGDVVAELPPERFFDEVFPGLADAHGHLAATGIRTLDARPLSMEVDGRTWTVVVGSGGDTIDVVRGDVDGAMVVHFDRGQFSDWAQQLRTLNALWVGNELRREGRQRDIANWDAIWIALLEGWPVVDETLAFVDRSGDPLDLQRAFTPDDDPADIAHFLRAAGFLHLRGWLDPAVMTAISEDIDRALPHYRPDDGRSWWATLTDGTERCVRLQHFVDHSPATADLLSSSVWGRVRRTLAGDDELVQAPVQGNCVEALVKPLSVVKGISDTPWHRDCNFGRHAYRCCSTTVGIAVSDGGETSGQLQAVAGSHRAAMPPDLADRSPYLPVVGLPTRSGDITVHLSCTLHQACPPITAERKVLYTGFGLPPRTTDRAGSAQALSRLRESVHRIQSQPPSPLAAG